MAEILAVVVCSVTNECRKRALFIPSLLSYYIIVSTILLTIIMVSPRLVIVRCWRFVVPQLFYHYCNADMTGPLQLNKLCDNAIGAVFLRKKKLSNGRRRRSAQGMIWESIQRFFMRTLQTTQQTTVLSRATKICQI